LTATEEAISRAMFAFRSRSGPNLPDQELQPPPTPVLRAWVYEVSLANWNLLLPRLPQTQSLFVVPRSRPQA
jgi:hypothetical protein